MGCTSKRQGVRQNHPDGEVANEALVALARNVVDRRGRIGWSQTDLATAAGVTQQRISLLESVGSDVTIETVTKIARALNTTVGKLLSC